MEVEYSSRDSVLGRPDIIIAPERDYLITEAFMIFWFMRSMASSRTTLSQRFLACNRPGDPKRLRFH